MDGVRFPVLCNLGTSIYHVRLNPSAMVVSDLTLSYDQENIFMFCYKMKHFRISRIGFRTILYLQHAQGHVLLFPEEYYMY